MAGTLLFNALKEAIDEEMANDVNVCVMGEDVGQYGGSYKVTKDLYEKYGELRVLDTPIAENSFTGMAVGAAMTGLRPIVEGMNMGFLLLAFNQISNNMGMLRYTSGGNYKIPAVVRGPGGVGRQLGAELEKKGIDVELIDLISLKPFDMETISKSIRKTNKVIIVEECMKTGGIGAELIALITEECFDDLDARPIRLSSQDIPTPYNGNLENFKYDISLYSSKPNSNPDFCSRWVVPHGLSLSEFKKSCV